METRPIMVDWGNGSACLDTWEGGLERAYPTMAHSKPLCQLAFQESMVMK